MTSGRAHDGLAWNETPEPRVLAVIAIVAEDKILIRGHQKLATPGEALHLKPPVGIDLGVSVDLRGKVAEGIGRGRLEGGIRLIKRSAVHIDAAVHDAKTVAGEADHTLDQQGRLGMMENDNVAALNGAIREHKSRSAGRRPVDLLVEEKKITHEQGALHALRGNEERFAGRR